MCVYNRWLLICATYKLSIRRYFTGHTRNPDGSVQFRAGQTKIGPAVDGAVKIFTVAVSYFVKMIISYTMYFLHLFFEFLTNGRTFRLPLLSLQFQKGFL